MIPPEFYDAFFGFITPAFDLMHDDHQIDDCKYERAAPISPNELARDWGSNSKIVGPEVQTAAISTLHSYHTAFAAIMSPNELAQFSHSDADKPVMIIWEKIKHFFSERNNADALKALFVLHNPSSSTKEKIASFTSLRNAAIPANQSLFEQTLKVNNGLYTQSYIIKDSCNPLILLMSIQQNVDGHELMDKNTRNSNPMVVYRIDTRPPEHICQHGFFSRGDTVHSLASHQNRPSLDTALISTTTVRPEEMESTSLNVFLRDSIIDAGLSSKTLSMMSDDEMKRREINPLTSFPYQTLIGEAKSYIYEILLDPFQGIDVNKSLNERSLLEDQNEFVIIEKISSNQIVGVYEVIGKYPSVANEIYILKIDHDPAGVDIM